MKKYLYILSLVLWIACDSSEKHTVTPPVLKGKIVFSKPIVSNPYLKALVIKQLDGDSEQYISDPAGDSYSPPWNPNWSPDAKKVVYVYDAFEGPFKRVIYIDSKADLPLGYDPANEPLWSPAGDKILSSFQYFNFQIIDSTPGFSSYVICFDGPDSLEWNSQTVFLKKGHARWNTEEEIFLLATPQRYEYSKSDSLLEIYRYDYVTKTLVERMTNNLLDEKNFEISLDHQRIVFTQDTGSSKVTYLMNTADTVATPIIHGKHETVKWFGKTHYLYYVRFPNPTVYFMDTDHPDKEYELMPVYNEHIDIWAEPDSAGE